jgi:hypothetical protein
MTLADYEVLPEFRERAAALERRLRIMIALDRPVPLAQVAEELQVPTDVAASWVTVLAVAMGEQMRITVTGLPS